MNYDPSQPRQDATTRKNGVDTCDLPTDVDAEADLLVRHREGDPTAFPALVERYRRPVWAYLGRSGVEDSAREDLFQEIFIKVHRAVGRFDAARPGHPWIFTIVANTVRNHLRKTRVRQLVRAARPVREDGTEPEPADTSPGAERRTAAREAAVFVQEQLQRLKPIQRQVVLLVCVERLPQKDVAEALELPLNTVKTHLRRSRLQLGRALVDNGFGGWS